MASIARSGVSASVLLRLLLGLGALELEVLVDVVEIGVLEIGVIRHRRVPILRRLPHVLLDPGPGSVARHTLRRAQVRPDLSPGAVERDVAGGYPEVVHHDDLGPGQPDRSHAHVVHARPRARRPGGDRENHDHHSHESHRSSNPLPAPRTYAPCGAGKCAGRSNEPRSTHASRSFRREAAAATRSVQATVLQSTSYACIGWWTVSPAKMASWPLDLSRVHAFPGVWPGVSSTVSASFTWWPFSIMSARPASTTGSALSWKAARRIGLGSGFLRQCSYSMRASR